MSCLLFSSYDSNCYTAKALRVLTPNTRYLWWQNTTLHWRMLSIHLICFSKLLLNWHKFLELWQDASHGKNQIFVSLKKQWLILKPFSFEENRCRINHIFISWTLGASNFHLAPKATQRPPFCALGRTVPLGGYRWLYVPRWGHTGNSPLHPRRTTASPNTKTLPK